jgi:hypothetical protein
MYDLTLNKFRACVVRQDRAAACQLLRVAITAGLIRPRDAIELMLVVRDGTPERMMEAIDAVRAGAPGSYRYVPAPDHAVA